MAIGDDAAADGMDLVAQNGKVKDGATEINKTRDYIAQKTNAVTPLTAGGTGATSASAALSNLGAVPTTDVVVSTGGGALANKIPRFDANARLAVSNPISDSHVATKAYADGIGNGKVATSGGTITGQLIVQGAFKVPNAGPATSDYTTAYINGDDSLRRGASSRRYKKNIRDANPLEFAGVLNLRPVTFQWRNTVEESDHIEVGLIAEEVAETVPWLAVLDKEGRPDSVLYERIGLALLPIVQAQAATIAQLNDRVKALEDERG